jgi:predicted MFS family arabinose efflux permease
VLGWAVGLPVPFLIMWAPAWGWIVAANVLLGINQGLCWSMTVIMKIDLVGPRQRGLGAAPATASVAAALAIPPLMRRIAFVRTESFAMFRT